MSNKKKNGYGKGTFVDTKIFLSPAFINLGKKGTSPTVSTCSHAVLFMLLGKRRFITGRVASKKRILERDDNNEYTLTYKELQSRGITQPMATRAFDELLAKGFISIAHSGGSFDKDKSKYSLEDDFLRWRNDSEPIRIRKKDYRHRGWQGQNAGSKIND